MNSPETFKVLGKIVSVNFGNKVGYQNAMLGIQFRFAVGHAGLSDDGRWAVWPPSRVKHDDRCKWSEEDRDRKMIEIFRFIDLLLTQAKVSQVSELVGIPVEIELLGGELGRFHNFRILEEVL